VTLQLDSVRFAYTPGGRAVVDDVSAQACAGRITAIIGPNAAGKSTLLRLMAGLLAPDGGTIHLDGRPVHRLDPRLRAPRLAYVPQRPRVDAPFTTAEVVALGRFAQPRNQLAVTESLRECALDEDAHRVLTTLSAGQQQRAALARALAQVHGRDDAILLLDEPTSALDPRHVQRTAAVLRRSAQQGRTIVVILHDLVLARRLSDEVWIMHEGRLVAAGATAEVCEPRQLERVYGVRFARESDVLLAQTE